MITRIHLERYKDGGTTGIFAYVSLPEFDIEHKNEKEPFITIDNGIKTDTPGQWYYGWKNKGGEEVPDEVKEVVTKAVKEYLKYQIILAKSF